jgi:hypothetical protein
MNVILSALILLCARNQVCESVARNCIDGESKSLEYTEPLSRVQQHKIFDKCFTLTYKADLRKSYLKAVQQRVSAPYTLVGAGTR